MNFSTKLLLERHIQPSWEDAERCGSILRVFLRIYPIGSDEPVVVSIKLKRWVDRHDRSGHGLYTIYDKANEAYVEIRRSLLEYTTVACLRRERLIHLVLGRYLPLLWKEFQQRGCDVQDGDYESYGSYFLEYDLRRRPLDRLALITAVKAAI
jgi:hypothetical protein